MASVLIKNLPDSLHQQLKRRAERHHRSLNKEVIALIEAALTIPPVEGPPHAVELNKPLDQELLHVTVHGLPPARPTAAAPDGKKLQKRRENT